MSSVDDMDYTLIRKNVKNLNLRIDKNGQVIVSAPFYCPKSMVDAFVISKEHWIQEKLEGFRYTREYVFTNEDYENFKRKLDILIPKWENISGLYGTKFHIKNMSTRWGSCNPKSGSISLNIQLYNKPDACIEYVILHELAHLKIANHSKAFYNLIAEYMPDYKQRRKMLNLGE